eukprot:GHVS01025530.1.p1 GENE.GHVS01025530.1~~GHVS01025530.1.p1  ORF type:complete len:161 (+),score=25.76 GHVS01025530.1:124-606(+)
MVPPRDWRRVHYIGPSRNNMSHTITGNNASSKWKRGNIYNDSEKDTNTPTDTTCNQNTTIDHIHLLCATTNLKHKQPDTYYFIDIYIYTHHHITTMLPAVATTTTTSLPLSIYHCKSTCCFKSLHHHNLLLQHHHWLHFFSFFSLSTPPSRPTVSLLVVK